MSERLNIKRLRIRDIVFPANILIVGPSASRKNAAVLRILDEIKSDNVVVVSSHPELYQDAGLTNQIQLYESVPPQEIKRADCRVLEDLADDTNFGYFDNKRQKTTVITIEDYHVHLPRSALAAIDYVFLFGGVKQIRRVWDDFGALIPKFKDFRQIYLACTDEGDRYCDDFMSIRIVKETINPAEVFFWSTLRREAAKDITLQIQREIILNKVHSAEEVQVAQEPPNNQANEPVALIEAEAEKERDENEREERDDCVIL